MDKFKELMGVKDEQYYNKFSAFRKRVIETAADEINDNANI